MTATKHEQRPKQWKRMLLAVLIMYPGVLVSSAQSAATKTKQHDQKMWGVIPKPKIETSFKIDFRKSNSEEAAVAHVFPRRMIVMGGPASGKGTQCEAIAEKHGLVHLSTGDMLRQAVSSSECDADSEAAPHISTIKKCMERGKLIPDEIIVRLVLDRLRQPDCQQRGWILDGYPRTYNQAKALKQAGIKPETFLFLDVPDEVAIQRACGRRTDPVTGKIYHLDFNPPPRGISDRLVQRSDDTVESMTQRLKQFRQNANAVKGSFDNILEINGLGTPNAVRSEIDGLLRLK